MKIRETLRWVVSILVVISFLAAILTPNLLRSREAANQSSLIARSRAPDSNNADDKPNQLALIAGSNGDRKLIRNAELALIVTNARAASDEIRKLTESSGGEIEKLEILESTGGYVSATILVRVPGSGLEDALARLKKLAVRTEREQMSDRDVTREFYDNEAHLRNLQAEEQQYLSIMKRAATIKDTLDVSAKLSDVRDRIERLQTQIHLMEHDIEMSLINIALMQEQDTQVLGIHWRPAYSAKIAIHESLAGLADWADWVVAVLIKLPLFAIWTVTIGGILYGLWKLGRLFWVRVIAPVHETDASH